MGVDLDSKSCTLESLPLGPDNMYYRTGMVYQGERRYFHELLRCIDRVGIGGSWVPHSPPRVRPGRLDEDLAELGGLFQGKITDMVHEGLRRFITELLPCSGRQFGASLAANWETVNELGDLAEIGGPCPGSVTEVRRARF